MANPILILLFIVIIIAIGALLYIQFFDNGGNNGNDNVCTGVTISKPTNINATDAGNGKINVSWDTSSDVESVNIYIDKSAKFTVSSSNFVSNETASKKMATIGPYKPDTYYIKVASIKGKCRSEAEPTNGKSVAIVAPKPKKVRIQLDLRAYGNPSCNRDFFGGSFYVTRTNNGCVSAGV